MVYKQAKEIIANIGDIVIKIKKWRDAYDIPLYSYLCDNNRKMYIKGYNMRFIRLLFLAIAVSFFTGCKDENAGVAVWDDELEGLDSGAEYAYYDEYYNYEEENASDIVEVQDPNFNYDEALKKKYGMKPLDPEKRAWIAPLPGSAKTLSIILSISLGIAALLSWKVKELIPGARKTLYWLMAAIGVMEVAFCFIPDIFSMLTKYRLVNAVLFVVLQIGIFIRITGVFRNFGNYLIPNSIALTGVVVSLWCAISKLGMVLILDALLGGVLSIVGFIILCLVVYSIYKGVDDPPSPSSSDPKHKCRYCYHYGSSTCPFESKKSPDSSCGHFTRG